MNVTQLTAAEVETLLDSKFDQAVSHMTASKYVRASSGSPFVALLMYRERIEAAKAAIARCEELVSFLESES